MAATPIDRSGRGPSPQLVRRTATMGTGLAVLVAIALALGLALLLRPLPLALAIAGGAGLVGMLALAVVRYDAAVALGVILLAVVRVEPAPVDAAFAVIIAVAAVTARIELRRMPLSMVFLSVAFVVLNVIATMDAFDLSRAGQFMATTVYLLAFGLWVSTYVDSTRRARLIVRYYVVTAVIFAFLSSAALYVHFPGSTLLLFPDHERAQGLFKDPNVYGPYLVPAALILLEELLQPRLLRVRPSLKIVGFAILAGGVVFSYSRAAALNLAVGVVVMIVVLALRRGGSRRATALAMVVVAFVLGLGGTLAATNNLTFLQERAQRQTYDTDRFGAQRAGIEFAERSPLGIGPGQFELLSPVSAHSTYIRALAEEGPFGAAVLIGLLFGTLVLAARNAVLGRATFGIGSTALLAAWAGAMANSVVVDTLHWRHLWLIAGLIWAAAARPDPDPDPV